MRQTDGKWYKSILRVWIFRKVKCRMVEFSTIGMVKEKSGKNEKKI